jgi:hypothetical protein
MSLMVFLEAAIGVVFAILVVSLLVSATNELIAAVFALRAKQLEEGVKRMLGGDKKMTALLFSHPLILLSSKSDRRGPSYLQCGDFAEALLDIISSKGSLSCLGAQYKDGFDLLKAVEDASLPPEVKKLVLSFAEGAKNDVETFRKKAEVWFDASMQRVSGWYNRKIRWISLLIGLVIALAANVDTIAIASRLAVDDTARAQVVAQSIDYLKQNQNQPASSEELIKFKGIIDRDLGKLERSGLIGWGSDTRIFVLDEERPNVAWNILLKLVGLLVTATAVSLGAPFWFDVLGKLASVRTSLQPSTGDAGAAGAPGAPASPVKL